MKIGLTEARIQVRTIGTAVKMTKLISQGDMLSVFLELCVGPLVGRSVGWFWGLFHPAV